MYYPLTQRATPRNVRDATVNGHTITAKHDMCIPPQLSDRREHSNVRVLVLAIQYRNTSRSNVKVFHAAIPCVA